MIAEQLAYLIRSLQFGSARPTAIWFVDRQEEYCQLLKTSDAMLSPLIHPLRFCGLLLHEIYASVPPKSRYYLTPFYRKPGVWIEMSDGNHVRVADELLA